MFRIAEPRDWPAVVYAATDADLLSIAALRDEYDMVRLAEGVLENPMEDYVTSWVWVEQPLDRPVALVGMSHVGRFDGVLEAWSFATPWLAQGHWLAYTRACRGLLDNLQRDGYHRIQAWSWPGHPTSARWLVCLGMKREGTFRKFGARGEDMSLFARVAT